MRVALLAVILVVIACGPASPRAQSSFPPTATPTAASSPNPTVSPAAAPTRVPGSPLDWAAPVLVDHQSPFEGSGIDGIACPTVNLCIAVEHSNVITSSNPTGGAAAWTVTSLDGLGGAPPNMFGVTCPSEVLCVAIDQIDANSDAIVTSINPTGGPGAWSVTDISGLTAVHTYRGYHSGINDISCPTISLCVAVDGGGNAITSTNPTGGVAAWKLAHVFGPTVCVIGEGSPPCGLQSVSCPTITYCIAVDFIGNLIASHNPTGGAAAWTATRASKDSSLGRVSCPAITFCVALDGGRGWILLTSTKPTGGAAAWTEVDLSDETKVDPANLVDASCPSISLCFVVDDQGDVIHSANPTGGAQAWTSVHVDADGLVGGVSCPSSSLCVAVDSGNVVTSSNPTGGPADWAMANVDSSNDVEGVSCPSISLCVAVDHFGNVATSTNPTGGPSAWTVTNLEGIGVSSLFRIFCPSSELCIATSEQIRGDWAYPILVTSTDPTGGPAAWKVTQVADPGVVGLSCPSITLCVAVGGNDVSTSTNPTGGSAHWTVAHLLTGSTSLIDLSCPTVSLCVALDDAGNIFTSSRPAGGVNAWKKVARASSGSNFQAMLSCPSADLCVAVDTYGDVAAGDPTGGAAVWKVTKVAGNHWLRAISCPGVNLCVALGYGGNVLTTIRPTGGAAAWKSIHAIGTDFLTGVSCPTVSLCVAVDSAGTVVIGTSQP